MPYILFIVHCSLFPVLNEPAYIPRPDSLKYHYQTCGYSDKLLAAQRLPKICGRWLKEIKWNELIDPNAIRTIQSMIRAPFHRNLLVRAGR